VSGTAGLTAGDIRRAAAFVVFAVERDHDAQVEVVLDALADGRFPQLDQLLRLLWIDVEPAVRTVLTDVAHLRRLIAKMRLAESRGEALPPPGWLIPAC
jgi:hypothetical protein